MAEKGFKRTLTAILSTNAKRCSRLMHDSEEPTSHKLTLYFTAKTDIGNTGSPSFIGHLDVMKGDS